MSLRRNVAAIGCAAAVTGSVFAAASPASAGGPGIAEYDCGAFGSPVTMKFSHVSTGPLSIVTSLTGSVPATLNVASTLDGAAGPTGTYFTGPVVLAGPFPTLNAAPNVVGLAFTQNGTPLFTMTCTRIPGTQTGSWPV